jgi:flagellar motor switch protein FliN
MNETSNPAPAEPQPVRLTAVEGGAAERSGPAVKAARFTELGEGAPYQGSETMDFLMDVGLTVAVELGRTEMPVRDVLGLSPGSVIELKRMANEPVEILVNNKVVARGEVVVVDDRFGVRITELNAA